MKRDSALKSAGWIEKQIEKIIRNVHWLAVDLISFFQNVRYFSPG